MEHLKKRVMDQSFEQDGKRKISCAAAFKLADELEVKVSEIGELCRAENIRICSCQLKCF